MGNFLAELQPLFVSPANPPRTDVRGIALPRPEGIAARRGGAAPPVELGREGTAARAFEAITYRAEQTTLAMRFQQAAARVVGDGAERGASQAAVGQLTFDFFFESRSEEVTLFRERTAAVGAGTGSQRFSAVASKVAAKFELSLTLTGAALDGFAGAAEGAAGAKEIFERLVAFADKILGQADALFEEIFALLGGSPAKGNADFVDRFLKGIDDILRQGGGITGPAGAGAGRSVSAFGFQLEFNFSFSAEITTVSAEVQQADPIVLDLNGNGFDLTSHKDGARFDILGNGRLQNTAFVTGGDAFLAIDRNGNGIIDSGRELFGDQNGAANGFEELRKLDSNGDGVIDRRDRDFDQLLLWRDNGNGITEAGELLSLRDLGIAAIDLNYTNTNLAAAGGNRVAQIASFLRTDGSRGLAGDVLLNYTV